MLLFVFYGLDHDGMTETRAKFRAEHRAHIETSQSGCRMVGAGPLTTDDGSRSIGSIIVLEATSREAADCFLAGDPFAREGVFAHSEVRAWNFALGPWRAALGL